MREPQENSEHSRCSANGRAGGRGSQAEPGFREQAERLLQPGFLLCPEIWTEFTVSMEFFKVFKSENS